ncbi:hypothetical protein SPLC1_S205780 [Arthrospira platensis C1]|nr:hypothetical protein SPLC1_S205780 [Arthrospira platensis C1]
MPSYRSIGGECHLEERVRVDTIIAKYCQGAIAIWRENLGPFLGIAAVTTSARGWGTTTGGMGWLNGG